MNMTLYLISKLVYSIEDSVKILSFKLNSAPRIYSKLLIHLSVHKLNSCTNVISNSKLRK